MFKKTQKYIKILKDFKMGANIFICMLHRSIFIHKKYFFVLNLCSSGCSQVGLLFLLHDVFILLPHLPASLTPLTVTWTASHKMATLLVLLLQLSNTDF